MADLAWSAWLDEAMVAKAPRQIVQNAVRDAARELCEKGKVYLLEGDATNVVANTKEYAWAKAGTTNVEAIEIWQALFQGYELEFMTRNALKEQYAAWSTQTGTPNVALKLRPSVVRLVPYPAASVASALVLWAFMRPTRSAVGIVDEIGERYYEIIATGARARLRMKAGTPYYDPQLGSSERQAFLTGIAESALKAELGETDQNLEGETEFF